MTSYRTNTANWKYVYNGNAFRDTVAEYIILIILALSLFQEWSSSCLWQTFLYSILPIHTARVRFSDVLFYHGFFKCHINNLGRENWERKGKHKIVFKFYNETKYTDCTKHSRCQRISLVEVFKCVETGAPGGKLRV